MRLFGYKDLKLLDNRMSLFFFPPAKQNEYMLAWESAGLEQDIVLFAMFRGHLVYRSLEGKPILGVFTS